MKTMNYHYHQDDALGVKIAKLHTYMHTSAYQDLAPDHRYRLSWQYDFLQMMAHDATALAA
jgi:hypothetical protein